MLDKIKGGLYGVAIGDAIGGTTEFLSFEEVKKRYGLIRGMIGGGVHRLRPGETTDDTAMTMCVAKGILKNPENPVDEIGKEFIRWVKSGPKDIGMVVLWAVDCYKGDWLDAAEVAHFCYLDKRSAGNGTLMRTLPIAFAYPKKKEMEKMSILQSKMTHYDNRAAEACVIYNRIARRMLLGESLVDAVSHEVKDTIYEDCLTLPPTCLPTGFVVNTMKWVVYIVTHSKTFSDGVLLAANLGEDSDTVGAIAGGLLGIECGYKGLPVAWREKILVKKKLDKLAVDLAALRLSR